MDQYKQILIDKVAVTNQMVTYAKSFILDNFSSDTTMLIDNLLSNVDAKKPEKIVIHQSVDTESQIAQAAKSISWRLAGCEAIWGLISSNCLIPGSTNLLDNGLNISWTTVVPGSGGQSSGWQLQNLSIPVPQKVVRPFSQKNNAPQPITDPDLYLKELSIDGFHTEIELSLRESVLCFKHELFLGCLALLGRASEGAWIELGLAIAAYLPEDAPINREKLRKNMEDPFQGIGKKIKEVLKAYERKDIFTQIYKKSGYNANDLKSSVVWADAVRESRNSVHYGAEPSMSNSYEKVAALLIGAVPNFKIIYSIIRLLSSKA